MHTLNLVAIEETDFISKVKGNEVVQPNIYMLHKK